MVEIPVTFQYLGKNPKATCRNIGLGGIHICSEVFPTVGTRLTLQVSFNRNLSFMGFTGILIYAAKNEENGSPQTYNLGIQFSDLRQVEEKVLEACILELATPPEPVSEGVSSSLIEKNLVMVLTDRPINASQMVRRRVVITGIGVISPIGIGRQAFGEGIREGHSGVKRVTRFDVTDLPSQLAAEIDDYNALLYLSPQRIKQMDRCTQFAVSAALLAVTDAELTLEKVDRERAGVLIGTAIGGLRWAFEQNLARLTRGYKDMNPRSMLATYPNAVSGQVSLELGLKGRADTISSGCASAGTAFGEAAELIQRGELDLVVVGGTEDPIEPTVFSAMCAAGALSTLNDDPIRTPRPFDAERDGPVLGEGAGVLIFEELEHALQRGAHIYAEFKGWGSTADAFSLARTDPSGQQASRAVRMALNDGGIAAEEVDYINAYGIATPSCDWAEARVIKEIFGDRASKIPISAIQSMLGYPWAAHGAFQIIANCLAITEGVIAPTINYATPDPNCALAIVPNRARISSVNIAMSNLFGCGKNVVVLVQRFDQ
jgi:3-oxoacyl-[acyl-carrier-protein] synthase II